MVHFSRIAYGGWRDCCLLSNGRVELVATASVGPRLIRFGLVGRENEFKEVEADLGQTGGAAWRLYGGHRLWHAPEHPWRTYVPDNEPVAADPLSDGVRLTQPVEAETGIQKEVVIRLPPAEARAEIRHRLYNRSLWPLDLAPWALSVMAPGGVAILPHAPRGDWPAQLLPTHTMTLWAFTDMGDPRWTWGARYVFLKQDAAQPRPQKIGLQATPGWLGYWRAGHLFVKTFDHRPGAAYPDLGSSVEIFTNASFLELETLGPTVRVEAGGCVEHIEQWHLFDEVPPIPDDDAADAVIGPRLRSSTRPTADPS